MRKFAIILVFAIMTSFLSIAAVQADEHNFCVSCEFMCADVCGLNKCPCDLGERGSIEAKGACICKTDNEKAEAGFLPVSDDVVVGDESEAKPVAVADESNESVEEESGSLPLPLIGGGVGLLTLLGIIAGRVLRGRKKTE